MEEPLASMLCMLSTEENGYRNTAVEQAVFLNKIDVLKVLLEHDWSLGYSVSTSGSPLLVSAAQRGYVGVARELLKHCPDAPYCDRNGWTCLHEAVHSGHTEFVEFVMGSQQLRNKLVNMRSEVGKTALHYAVEKCNPRILQALLLNHTTTDFTMISSYGREPSSGLLTEKEPPNKISDWNEVSMLLLQKDPNNASFVYYIHRCVKDMVTNASSKAFKSLTQTLIGNTFLVAILIATITFAAAFTLPGGYNSEGLPTMARKAAFQAFLISDALAMCSSLAVAFICIIARWEDIGFLLYYRSFTKKLMWLSYMATTTAFATGLYTVLAPRLLWLAIAVCTLPVLLPIFTKLLDELPFLSLRLRLGRTFKSELLDIV